MIIYKDSSTRNVSRVGHDKQENTNYVGDKYEWNRNCHFKNNCIESEMRDFFQRQL